MCRKEKFKMGIKSKGKKAEDLYGFERMGPGVAGGFVDGGVGGFGAWRHLQ